MFFLPDCDKIDRTEEHIVMGKTFGANGEGYILHKFPVSSEPERKRLDYEKAFEILYEAARKNDLFGGE